MEGKAAKEVVVVGEGLLHLLQAVEAVTEGIVTAELHPAVGGKVIDTNGGTPVQVLLLLTRWGWTMVSPHATGSMIRELTFPAILSG